jgi:glycosyltransferase involved in cell wall biosynthesis
VRGADVEHLFSTADAYVMPSVSEPFGISALEAMSYETPVILSRQSGASEVLRHALKVDFWDVDRLAAQIIAVLQYPELRSSIVEMAREEVRRVHWEAAATKVKRVYERALGEG